MNVPLRCIKPETIPDPYVIGVSMAGLGTDSTRVFRMPIDDATAPDLMKSTKIVNPVISMKTPAGELRWKPYGYFDLAYMPQWMRTPVYHRDAPAAGEKKRFLNGPFTPAGEREFRRICREVAAARAALTPAGERNFYEFGWEPHYPWNWTGTPDDIVTRYRIGAEEVRAADPHAFILGPNGAGLTAEYLQYYRDLFARGIGEFIDGISIHPYPKGYPPESRNMAELIRLLKELSRNSIGRELPIL